MDLTLPLKLKVDPKGAKMYEALLNDGKDQMTAASQALVTLELPKGMVETVQLRRAALSQPGALQWALEEAGLVPKKASPALAESKPDPAPLPAAPTTK